MENNEYNTLKRMDRAISERMDRKRKNTREMRKFHDSIKRSRDRFEKSLDR